MKRTYFYWSALAALCLLLLGYLLARAALLSITHDEAGTTDFAVVPVWDIMFAARQFETANNHILNSLLLKGCVALYGYHEWAVRLPNVLAFLLYFVAGVSIVQLLTQHSGQRLAGMLLLCGVPYLLDFFALARGYGLANAWSMAAIAALLFYVRLQQTRWLWRCFAAAALAAYANFTWLNLYLTLWVVIIVLFIGKNGIKAFRDRQFVQHQIPPLLIGLLLALLSYRPISYLQANNEFKWGAETFVASLQTLAADLLYNQTFPFLQAEQSKLLLMGLLLFLPLLMLIAAVRLLIQKRLVANPTLQLTAVIAMVLIVMTAGIIAQRHLLGTYYIDGRKATLYIPPLLVLLTGSMLLLWQTGSTGKIAALLLTFMISAAFVKSINLYSCREWWYDANSKEVATALAKEGNTVVALSWQFAPAFQFYNQHHFNNRLILIKTNEIPQPSNARYYYVMGDEIRNVPPQYRPVQRFFWDRFLLKKDTVAYLQQLYTISGRLRAAKQTATDALQQAANRLKEERRTLVWEGLFWNN
ncbi:MAG: hypothetical protein ACK4E8_01795 [Lacibacter sp.]